MLKEDQWITIGDNSSPLLAILGTNQGGFVVQFATELCQQGGGVSVKRLVNCMDCIQDKIPPGAY